MYAKNPNSYGSLTGARQFLKDRPDMRDELLDCIARIEKQAQAGSSTNVREEVTGPLVDLLFAPDELLKRTLADGTSFTFRYSSKIARDFVMARQPRLDHVWEPQTTKTVVALSRGKSQVIIGGAYFGDHAILVGKTLGPAGLCHCFELASDNIAMLSQNARDNGLANIRIIQQALWSRDGAAITLSGSDSHASPQEAEGDAVDNNQFISRTIDSYVAEQQLTDVDVIMLDIEGGEHDALVGAAGALSADNHRAPAVISEIHGAYTDWSQGLRATPQCALLISHGYEVFAIRDYQGNDPSAGDIVELVDIDSAVIAGPRHGFNLLAVKSRTRLDPAVFRIVANVSPKLLHHRDQAIHGPLTRG
jgi:FkbM family methyltransferase